MTKTEIIVSWMCRLVAAAILLQTLYFKFTGAEESKFIFSALGVEPVGRIGAGVAELITAVLLLIPATAWLGAILGVAVMAGAIGAHLTKIGIVVQNDGGLLFALALAVLACSAVVLWLHRHAVPIVGAKFS